MAASIWDWFGRRVGMPRLIKAISLYPPYLGAGIHVTAVNAEVTRIEVAMPLRASNRNFVGTQFGGSMYSMCDPWFMFILLHNLGPEFIVWDKAATIRFLKPGRGTVRAVFELSREEIENVRRAAVEKG